MEQLSSVIIRWAEVMNPPHSDAMSLTLKRLQTANFERGSVKLTTYSSGYPPERNVGHIAIASLSKIENIKGCNFKSVRLINMFS
ncbi:MAG: hypothetical protein ACTS4T_01780 [Candidatus Hodgkinia cicadicola]